MRAALAAPAVMAVLLIAAATGAPTASASVPVGAPTLTATKASYVRGETAKFTFTIKKVGAAKAGGTVAFEVDGSSFGAPLTVTAGKAIFTTNALSIGDHQVLADYSGDGAYPPARTPAVAVSVTQGSTVTTAAVRNDPVPPGTAAVISSLAKRVGPAAGGTLAGTTTFTASNGVDTPTVATVPAASNGSSPWRPKLANGSWTVTAVYSGNGDFTGSTSAPITLRVGPPATPDASNPGPPTRQSYPEGFTAQTFVGIRTGTLTAVALNFVGNMDQAHFTLAIETVGSDGYPSGDELVSQTFDTVSGLHTYPFSTGAAVTARSKYAIVIKGSAGLTNISETSGDAYPVGQLLTDFGDGYGYQVVFVGLDLVFTTYVA